MEVQDADAAQNCDALCHGRRHPSSAVSRLGTRYKRDGTGVRTTVVLDLLRL